MHTRDSNIVDVVFIYKRLGFSLPFTTYKLTSTVYFTLLLNCCSCLVLLSLKIGSDGSGDCGRFYLSVVTFSSSK
jgi:hypothetical protein